MPLRADKTLRDPRKPTEEVVALDVKIAELEAQLSALRFEKVNMLGRAALINSLPPEVLARVFELGVHENPHLVPALHLVSSLWRRTALSTPTLSSYLKLDSTIGYGRTPVFLAHAQTLLERSGAAKLHIDLDFRYADNLAELEQTMAAVGPHLGRCFVFRVSVPDWEWLGVVKHHAGSLGPALEELYLRIDPTDNDEVLPAPFLTDDTAYPRLARVMLEHAPLLAVREATLPALRALHVSRDQRYHSSGRMGVPLREVLCVLEANAGLAALRVHGVRFQLDGTESAFSAAPAPVRAHALATLTLVHVEAAHVSLLLASVALPALRRLVLHMDGTEEETLACLAAAAAQQPSPFPALRTLDLRNVNVDGAALLPLVQALRALPRLTAFGVCSPPSGIAGPKLFDLLARPCEAAATPPPADASPPQSRWLLPDLRALCIQNCRDISGHEILRVLRARIMASLGDDEYGGYVPTKELEVERIRHVRINQCFGVEDEMIESIRGVVDVLKA